MAITLVQSKDSTTLDNPPSAGNLLVLTAAARDMDLGGTVTATGWSRHPSNTTPFSGDGVAILYRTAGTAETTNTIAGGALLLGGGNGAAVGVSEWSGGLVVDAGATTAGTTNPLTGGTVTPTAGAEVLIVGAFGVKTNDVFGWGGTTTAPWTELHDDMTSSNFHPLLYTVYQAVGTASGAYTPAGTLTPDGTGPYGAQTLAFRTEVNPAPPGVGIEFTADEWID